MERLSRLSTSQIITILEKMVTRKRSNHRRYFAEMQRTLTERTLTNDEMNRLLAMGVRKPPTKGYRVRANLSRLLQGVTPENMHPLVDFGVPVGLEIL